MSEAIARVPLPLKGVHREVNQQDLPADALFSSENWLGRDGRFRTRAGLATIASTTGDRPNGFVGYIDADGTPVLLMGTDDTIFKFDDATQLWVDLSATFTADATHSTVFRVFMLGTDSVVYAQNGKDAPVQWQLPDAAVAAVTGTNMPIAKAMMVLADRVLLGNLTGAGGSYLGELGPAVVTVSASQDPANGYDLTDGLVAQLADTPGAIVAMRELGALQGVIYKTDAVYLATASSGVEPFTFEPKKLHLPGPVSERAVVVSQDGRHYYLALDGNVMVFDGIEPVPLGRHVQRYVLDTWDIDSAFKAHGVYDDENREIVFWYVGTGASEPNRSIVVRLDDISLWPMRYENLRITAAVKANLPGGTTIGELVGDIGSQSLTLGEYDALGQTFMVADVAGQAFKESGSLDNAAPIPCFFETGTSDFNSPIVFKSLRYLDHEFTMSDGDQDLIVTLQKSDYGEDITGDMGRTIQTGEPGPYRTHHRLPARNYGLRMDATVTFGIEWHGSTAVYNVQGRR